MSRVCIGVRVHAEPAWLLATLASLERHTAADTGLLLLPDGPDRPTVAALAKLRDLPQNQTAEPAGAAACFNRLAAASDAEVLVLLESGALVGPGWLDRLLTALDAHPRHGLAGPSTNRCWNGQGLGDWRADSLVDLERRAAELAERFGAETRALAPLYSLADFCYVVRRAVIDTIGAADEGYGLAPFWEMNYNLRAARAGFHGVWACAAYVHRAPASARSRREESRGFEFGNRRYQDAFCGLRLRGERDDYEPICRGDACEHFAPAGLIRVQLPAPRLRQFMSQTQAHAAPARSLLAVPHAIGAAPSAGADREQELMVSCIMPTSRRPAFVLQSIRYFQRQSYQHRELIIVDDGADDLGDQLPDDPQIRYVRLPQRSSIGFKRNYACALARGAMIAHWDDDDWYAPERLEIQTSDLLAGTADVSGLITSEFFELESWRFWRCTPDLHRRLFVADVHGGTLAYRREVWERLARYPDQSLAEDAVFLRHALHGGARLVRVAGERLFIYVRHSRSSWPFTCGQYVDPAGWREVGEPDSLAPDRLFYAALSPSRAPMSALPLVSCIMPTYNRRPFVAQAIRYFQRQDYPNRELLILDDGADRVADLIPADQRVRYIPLDQRLILGAKRNLGCELARGDIIAHWDDDDWYPPHRLRYQLAEMQRQQADLCGVRRLLFYDPRLDQTWLYSYPPERRPWVAGTTLCYRKVLWQRGPFPAVAEGEDTQFVWSGNATNLLALPDHRIVVAIMHNRNTSRRFIAGQYWRSRDVEEVDRLLGDDMRFYRLPTD